MNADLGLVFISLVCCKLFVQLLLSLRNVRYIQAHRDIIPAHFSSLISLEQNHKAADYSVARLRFSQLGLVLDALLLLFWFGFEGLMLLDEVLPTQISGDIRGMALIVVWGAINFIWQLPRKYWSHFVLEEKFGYNRRTHKTFAIDLIKEVLLSAALGLPVIYAIMLFLQANPQWWWLYTWTFISVFQLLLVWIYPNWIAPLFNQFKPLDDPNLSEGVNRLVEGSGHHLSKILVMDASKRSGHGNAYFTGLGKEKRVVFFDTLLQQMGATEILAVLAHEIGHMVHGHIRKSIVLSLLLSFVGFALVGLLMKQDWFWEMHAVMPLHSGIILLTLMSVPSVYLFWFGPFMSYFSRRNEFEADRYAAKTTSAQDMVQALMKLYRENSSSIHTDPWYATFYHSHPPAQERVAALLKL